jgi:hypothetical protein
VELTAAATDDAGHGAIVTTAADAYRYRGAAVIAALVSLAVCNARATRRPLPRHATVVRVVRS